MIFKWYFICFYYSIASLVFIFQQDGVKESKKRARDTDKKDVVKKDDEVPAKRGRGRPPKSGGGKKSDKPKVLVQYFKYVHFLIF